MAQHCITYHLDRHDRIVYIGDGWQAFADENKAGELTRERVVGRSMYDFISNKESRHLYELIVQRCREQRLTMNIPFRCDAPDKRRFLNLEISPLADGGLAFVSCIKREEPRSPVALLDREADRSDELIVICSWCKQVRLDENRWVPVEEAVAQLGLFNARLLPRLSHGMCETCHQQQMRELRDGD